MAGSLAKKASTPSKGSASATKSSSAKKNHSILKFFQKTDAPIGATTRQSRITQFVGSSVSSATGLATPKSQGGSSSKNDSSEGLFLEDKKGLARIHLERTTLDVDRRSRSRTPDDIWGDAEDLLPPNDSRDAEDEQSAKRRKMDSPDSKDGNTETGDRPKTTKPKAAASSINGPFIDESDSEEDLPNYHEITDTPPAVLPAMSTNVISPPQEESPTNRLANQPPLSPSPLVRDVTTDGNDFGTADFDDIEEGDELIGEEFRERPWDDEDDEQAHGVRFGMMAPNDYEDALNVDPDKEGSVTTCPICQQALANFTEAEVSVHVNDCLDGKPSVPPTLETPDSGVLAMTPVTQKEDSPSKEPTRMEKAAIARPPQRDPFSKNTPAAGSAFSKMMAGNAEDTAWAAAAANEVSSRGKQAYQRTCPFYKIMPGFSICVDAFRYGAVEGCKAYFLSHFHSDHYIGLTKSWCHGPIYCSRPTGNLVRQQLRVDPKWVVDLEFESPFEVPNTGGVKVTMINANHCPGSSLFLFEKSFGNGANPRRQRILHCGDFRASPDHLQHPLLRPDTIDVVTGKPVQQRLDTCYLDTTYLHPKYAFPSQEDVIAACSELCLRLNEESGVGGDLGKTAGGSLMSKFLSSTSNREASAEQPSAKAGRLLVVMGTYSIGKERICVGIAKALGSKIFANPYKQRICACLEDPELTALLTSDPREAQVHMQTLFEIRADTLADYLDTLKPDFTRVVGFRPTGWSYRPPAGRMLDNPPSRRFSAANTGGPLSPRKTCLHSAEARAKVPVLAEHSSFRELTMFCCALRIGRIIPTVNIGSQRSRDQMKAWIDRWEGEKKRNGLFPVADW
ncbi:DNA cross-link repair protein pso2/snm1 [Penicillium diatomitis]|uniref:DNA cross-link repair protein pso2/snm1 n=1 Tax=Penicillium diatomitis TaxID=2819901 RepID=A0A9W9WTR1_9EURO|nr:DNA cross-link repair protein pso2/snm1 [Penicillium diatomitis]KAJ5475344.1 DNA cross-link repair protein pso2/snm1 [Penicillium diatomitis]